MAGRKWLHGFLLHHPDIALKKAHNLSIARAMGANPTVIGNWFKLLKDIKDTAGIISPDQIWSGDETGIQNVLKEVKVLGMKHIRTFQQVSSEQGETSTVLSFVSAGGKVCPPLVIHKGQQVQETWCLKAPRDIQLSATTKEYITKSRFHQYGVHFIKYLKKEGLANKKNLLIVDGHKSHLYNLPFYKAMRANGIEVLTIPLTHCMCCSPSIVCRSHNSKRTGRTTFADTIPRIQGDRSIQSIFGKFLLHHGIRP